MPLDKGHVSWDGFDLRHLSRRALAKKIALLPQRPEAPEGLTLKEVVAHARYAHRSLWAGQTDEDLAAIEDALERTGTRSLSDRWFDGLSGGEQQRGWIALALAQAPKLLLLDEPTSHLDIGHQLDVLRLLRDLANRYVFGCLVVLHDINHAAQLADRIIALKEGVVIADGAPTDVVTPMLINELFDARMDVTTTVDGRPFCAPPGVIKPRYF